MFLGKIRQKTLNEKILRDIIAFFNCGDGKVILETKTSQIQCTELIMELIR